MNRENSRKIMEDFPEYFKYIDDIRTSLMVFGFSCDDGWFELIYNLCRDIKPHYDKLPYRQKEDFFIIQVKEKYGGLSFYTSHLISKEVSDLIDKAEYASYHICEICGKEGSLSVRSGWYKTLCEEHRKEFDYQRVKLKE